MKTVWGVWTEPKDGYENGRYRFFDTHLKDDAIRLAKYWDEMYPDTINEVRIIGTNHE